MKTAKEILEPIQYQNHDDLTYYYHDDVIKAMQEQAIAFAEWIETTNWSRSTENCLWYSFDVQDTGITTAELYTLFNTNNTNNGE
jgi:hypothetical protein